MFKIINIIIIIAKFKRTQYIIHIHILRMYSMSGYGHLHNNKLCLVEKIVLILTCSFCF